MLFKLHCTTTIYYNIQQVTNSSTQINVCIKTQTPNSDTFIDEEYGT